MGRFWKWFYGEKNPYWPYVAPPKWYPEILTPRWWRWCLYHDWRPWHGLAPERIRLYYVRRIRSQVRRPICWIMGHQPYDSSSWGYSAKTCSRCRKCLFYKKHPGGRKRVTI